MNYLLPILFLILLVVLIWASVKLFIISLEFLKEAFASRSAFIPQINNQKSTISKNRKKCVGDIFEQQSQQAILFLQHIPPNPNALSFFGGKPVAGKGFVWPRSLTEQDEPLTFLMQVDCSAIPSNARLDILPEQGVIYFFALVADEKLGTAFQVVYQDGPTSEWSEVEPPKGLQPSADHFPVAHALKPTDVSGVLPRWSFTPVVAELTVEDYVDEDGVNSHVKGQPRFWPGISTQSLKSVQSGDYEFRPYTIDELLVDGQLMKPFSLFPQDWRAVEIVMGSIIKRVDYLTEPSHSHFITNLYPDLNNEDDIRARLNLIRDRALDLFDEAKINNCMDEVPLNIRDKQWHFLKSVKEIAQQIGLPYAINKSIESSVSLSPITAARIPEAIAKRVCANHMLVPDTKAEPRFINPNRMLSPPSYVQGAPHRWASRDVLLLELSDNAGLGHHFAEGVLQFHIAPRDLKARRFHKVKLEVSAY